MSLTPGQHVIVPRPRLPLADVRVARTAAAAPVPSAHPGSSEAGSAPNTKQPAAAILKTCAELRALMEKASQGLCGAVESADDEWDLVAEDADQAFASFHDWPKARWDARLHAALRNAAPALLKAAEQNERRGELLKLAAIEVGSEMSADLEDDIAKELP